MTLPSTTSPVLALKASILARLGGDGILRSLLGGARIYDKTPRGQPFPFATFGTFIASDNSTSSDRGHETRLDMLVFSRDGSTKEALLIADRIEALLHDAGLVLTGHRLVNLALVDSDTALERDGETTRITLDFRAVTEVTA